MGGDCEGVGKYGSNGAVLGDVYKSVTQLVLLYVSESWVITGSMVKVLESFHHQSARKVTRMTEKSGLGGKWEYPLVVAALEAAGLYPIM